MPSTKKGKQSEPAVKPAAKSEPKKLVYRVAPGRSMTSLRGFRTEGMVVTLGDVGGCEKSWKNLVETKVITTDEPKE